jgi:hypothetical protein
VLGPGARKTAEVNSLSMRLQIQAVRVVSCVLQNAGGNFQGGFVMQKKWSELSEEEKANYGKQISGKGELNLLTVMRELACAMLLSDVCPSVIFAFLKTGRVATEENKHLFTAEELAEWQAAIGDYWDCESCSCSSVC